MKSYVEDLDTSIHCLGFQLMPLEAFVDAEKKSGWSTGRTVTPAIMHAMNTAKIELEGMKGLIDKQVEDKEVEGPGHSIRTGEGRLDRQLDPTVSSTSGQRHPSNRKGEGERVTMRLE
jgi:hypothetical protein